MAFRPHGFSRSATTRRSIVEVIEAGGAAAKYREGESDGSFGLPRSKHFAGDADYERGYLAGQARQKADAEKAF